MATAARTRTNGAAGIGGGLVTALPYYRVSGEEQEREGLSLDTQAADCRRYVADRSGLRWSLGEEYTDVLSGKRDDRPHYQRLLTDVRRLRAEGQRVVVVVKWLDRFGRHLKERVRSRDELKALGVPTHSVMEGGEVSDLVANMLAVMAEEETRRLGERVREVLAYVERNGWKLVGRCPWGYAWRDRTEAEKALGAPEKVLELEPVAAPAVEEVFRRLDGGETLRSVARWVAELPEAVRGGRGLSFAALRSLVRARVYIGWSEPDVEGVAHKGRWPVLIDPALWQRVQDRLDAHQKTPRQASGRYLLTGFLRCPVCGNRMAGKVKSGGDARSGRYACISWALGANTPARKCAFSVSTPVLDAAVAGTIDAIADALLGSTHPRVVASRRRVWRELTTPSYAADVQARVERLEATQAQASKWLGDAAMALIRGELDKAGYDLARQRIARDLEAAAAELRRLQAEAGKVDVELPPLEEALADLNGWRAARQTGDVVAQREVLGHLIDHVTPERLGRGTATAHPAWTPLGDALRRVARQLTPA